MEAILASRRDGDNGTTLVTTATATATTTTAIAARLQADSGQAPSRVLLLSHGNINDNHHHLHQHQNDHNHRSESQFNDPTGSRDSNVFRSDRVTGVLEQYVNLNLVRRMIAQNLIEILIICVIIIYLVYYFNQISKRPRLIGNRRSKFVQFIKTSLGDTLTSRFSPLIYFWGTNPQTALFGYLQGQSSVKEMPRSSFHRQYLYVSDAQYLTSNVDLSKHYQQRQQQQQQKQQQQNPRRNKRQQLQLKPLDIHPECHQSSATRDHQPTSTTTTEASVGLLNQNIRMVLDQMLQQQQQQQQQSNSTKDSLNLPSPSSAEINAQQQVADDQFVVVVDHGDCSKDQDQSSSSGSSSDSGVFATGGNSPSSGSSSRASSLADVLIDNQQQQQLCDKCNSNNMSASASANKQSPICDFLVSSGANPDGLGPCQVEAATEQALRPLMNERLEFGQCALDWHRSSHKLYHKNKLVALISAGMTTGSDKKYVTDTVQTLEALGYEVCVFIRRGVGGLKLSSAKFFSPAKWRDFEAAVVSIRQQRPGAHLVAIGFSFGSIELCRYLSMSGKRSLIDAALLISCPFDPEAGGRNMRKRALNRRIDAYLAKNLGRQLYEAMFGAASETAQAGEKLSAFTNYNGSMVNLASLPKIKSLVDFEDNFNRVLQNYPNSEAYAADSRLQHHLASIETPTLCLSSGDDFMAPLKLLPLEQIEANENLCMVLTRRGGHMAFIDGILWPKKPYFAQRIIGKYMASVKECLFSKDGHKCHQFGYHDLIVGKKLTRVNNHNHQQSSRVTDENCGAPGGNNIDNKANIVPATTRQHQAASNVAIGKQSSPSSFIQMFDDRK